MTRTGTTRASKHVGGGMASRRRGRPTTSAADRCTGLSWGAAPGGTARHGDDHPMSTRSGTRSRTCTRSADAEIVLRFGLGRPLEDVDGRSYVDATAGLWYCNVGYGRAEIVDAVAAQMRASPRTATSARTRPADRSTSPSASASWRRSPARPCSSPPAAPRRSTPPRSSPGATGTSRQARKRVIVARASGATTG